MTRPGWRLVVFDLDGTLVDSFPWFLSVLPEVAARHRFRVPDPAEREALRRVGPRAVGTAFGAVTWGYGSAEGLRAQGPVVVFESVMEIAGRLRA